MDSRSCIVHIYEDEASRISKWTLQYPNIETGGDIFGLWLNENEVVIQAVIGPGQNCRRTSTWFFQDEQYLNSVGELLIRDEGLCVVGSWRSHHTMNIPEPGHEDKDTVWRHLPTPGRFVLLIATIEMKTGAPKVQMGFNLFESTSEGNKVIPMKLEILQGRSPVRANKAVSSRMLESAEITADPEPQRPESSVQSGLTEPEESSCWGDRPPLQQYVYCDGRPYNTSASSDHSTFETNSTPKDLSTPEKSSTLKKHLSPETSSTPKDHSTPETSLAPKDHSIPEIYSTNKGKDPSKPETSSTRKDHSTPETSSTRKDHTTPETSSTPRTGSTVFESAASEVNVQRYRKPDEKGRYDRSNFFKSQKSGAQGHRKPMQQDITCDSGHSEVRTPKPRHDAKVKRPAYTSSRKALSNGREGMTLYHYGHPLGSCEDCRNTVVRQKRSGEMVVEHEDEANELNNNSDFDASVINIDSDIQQPTLSQNMSESTSKSTEPKDDRTQGTSGNSDRVPKKGIALIGDSIIKNVSPVKLSKRKVYKFTYPGETTIEITNELAKINIKPDPSHVVIHAGTNDVPVESIDECVGNMEKLITTAKQKFPNSKIGISGLTLRQDSDLISKIEEINEKVQSLSSKHDVTFISNMSIDETCLNSSGLHLNAKGTAILATHFIKFLRDGQSLSSLCPQKHSRQDFPKNTINHLAELLNAIMNVNK
ncbi:Hypothetical predicted protein [Paramuricea clavata]|uniref:SGNH hydrolase-type esterase domain-containing protein n=1 Tax=Paramuricea clavata TaxID=317549 RepID=A0A6S7KDP6_PARCT|nr:Hypothetical predicted protein [Paramuricea clavata]